MKTYQIVILICIVGGLIAEQKTSSSHFQLVKKQLQNAQNRYNEEKGTLFLNTIENSEYHFNVTNNNTVCVVFDGDFTFFIPYISGKENTSIAEVHIPEVSHSNIKVDGSCTDSSGQWIAIYWGDNLPKSSMKLSFNDSDTGSSWELIQIEAVIVMDNKTFPNATKQGDVLESFFTIALDPMEMPFNRSYKCFSLISSINSTTYVDNKVYSYPIYLSMKSVQMQAYNLKTSDAEFVRAKYCKLDHLADVLPKIVGFILSAVIFTMLVAHFCCPHDGRMEYERI